MTMISEPIPGTQPLLVAIPQTSRLSPEIRLATLASVTRDAIQSRCGTGCDDEAAGASGSAPADDDSLSVAHRRKLQCAVAEYSQQMRDLGHYPEKVLVAVKSAIREVAAPVTRKPVLDAMVHDAAQWSIAAYFDTNVDGGTPP